jgi:hypothetical protein
MTIIATSSSNPTFNTTSHFRKVFDVRRTTVPIASTNGAEIIPVT